MSFSQIIKLLKVFVDKKSHPQCSIWIILDLQVFENLKYDIPQKCSRTNCPIHLWQNKEGKTSTPSPLTPSFSHHPCYCISIN